MGPASAKTDRHISTREVGKDIEVGKVGTDDKRWDGQSGLSTE
jgi:hypothetical protein